MSVDPQSSQFVNDLKSTNSKQLLNAYVYDFLIKSSLPQTAQSFIKEAEVPTGPPTAKTIKRPQQKDLLPLAISLDAPQGFLYEWWQIFWDVFNARTHRGGSENAQHYYQLQLLRQHKEHALHNSTFHAAHTQAQAQAQAQAQLQAQMAQSQSQTYGQMSIDSIPQQQQQMLLQQQYQQQMLLLQYQQQQNRNNSQFNQGLHYQQSQQTAQGAMNQKPNSAQGMIPHHQGGPAMQQQFNQMSRVGMDSVLGNGNGAPPVTQMSPHLQQLQPNQQQQDVQHYFQQQQQQQQQQHQQQQQSQLFAGQKRGVNSAVISGNGPMNPNFVRVQQAQLQMNQFRQQQVQQAQFAGQNQQAPFKTPSLAGGNTTSGKRTNTPNKKMKLEEQSQKGSPLAQSPHTKDMSTHDSPLGNNTKLNGANVPSPLVNQTITEDQNESSLSSGQSALQDYQKQLMLLESENKKMLNGSKKDFETASATTTNGNKKEKTKKMPPPKKAAKGASSTTSPAKATSSTPLATATTTVTGRKKKEPVARRRSKKNANSEPPTPTTPLTPNPLGNTTNMAMLKKESSTVSKLAGIEENASIKDKNTPSSQLTPPISENAINSNNDATNSFDTKDITNAANIMNPISTEDKFENESFPAEDEIIGGSQLLNESGNNDVYSDFGLSDFSNDISGDGNFNLETFLNTDGADMGSFDNYWRGGVEATD